MATDYSQSSREDVQKAIARNASYSRDNSVSMAYEYETACSVWMTCWAFKLSKTGQAEVWMPTEHVQAELTAVRNWISGQPQRRSTTGGNIFQLSVENFR